MARESLKRDGIDDPTGPWIGAVVAAGVSCVAPMTRIALHKGLGISDALLGVGEDYLALRLGTEATDITMGQVSEIAREAIDDLRGRVVPSLPSIPATAEMP